jgi:hypothetical protein
LPEALSQTCLRLAAVQRRTQARHLASAALQDQYADRLDAWLERSGQPDQRPVFTDAMAAIGLHSATVRSERLIPARPGPQRGALAGLQVRR